MKALRLWSAKARGRFGKGRFGKGGQTTDDKKDIIIKVDEAVVSEDNSAFTTMPLPTKGDLTPAKSVVVKEDKEIAASMSGVTLNIVNENNTKPKDEKKPCSVISDGKKSPPASPTKSNVASGVTSPIKATTWFSGRPSSSLRKSPTKEPISKATNKTEVPQPSSTKTPSGPTRQDGLTNTVRLMQRHEMHG